MRQQKPTGSNVGWSGNNGERLSECLSGYASAQTDLGYMYKTGRGVEQDYAEGLKWCRLSVYWVIFCTAALVRPVTEGRARLLDLGTSVLNMVGLLSLCAWQMTEHIPGNMHFLAATAAIAFAVIAIVDRVQQRPSEADDVAFISYVVPVRGESSLSSEK